MSRYKAQRALRPRLEVAVPDTAMVLAAGLGKRMRPLTATRPKPLVEVAGRTLIDHTLDRFAEAGVGKVVVNVHYFADALEAHLAARDDLAISISDERSCLLETGGGVVKALPLIEAETFYVANSDNIWIDGPVDSLHLLAQRWDEAEMDALLLLVPFARAYCHDGPGDFHMDAIGRLSRRRPGRVAPFSFTGVQLVSRRLFENAPEGPFSTNILWNRAIEAGRCFGVVHQGQSYFIGTPEAVKHAEALLQNV